MSGIQHSYLQHLQQLTVLYVEDDDETQSILSGILGDYVGNLLLAKDGEEAFEIFETTQVDLILTDILMPKMSGIELMKKVRQHKFHASTPIILITAFTETHFLLDSIKLQCNGYILKPINLDELLERFYITMLPRLQIKEIVMKNRLLEILDGFVGGKKVAIVQYIIEHSDKEQIFYGSHDDIADKLQVSRQTVIKTFQQLFDLGFLEKIRNKVYRLCYKTNV